MFRFRKKPNAWIPPVLWALLLALVFFFTARFFLRLSRRECSRNNHAPQRRIKPKRKKERTWEELLVELGCC